MVWCGKQQFVFCNKTSCEPNTHFHPHCIQAQLDITGSLCENKFVVWWTIVSRKFENLSDTFPASASLLSGWHQSLVLVFGLHRLIDLTSLSQPVLMCSSRGVLNRLRIIPWHGFTSHLHSELLRWILQHKSLFFFLREITLDLQPIFSIKADILDLAPWQRTQGRGMKHKKCLTDDRWKQCR